MLEKIILGTYTKKSSQGIYEIFLDTHKKQLLNLDLVQGEDNPTYLALSDTHRLYTVSKDNDFGGVASYQEKEGGTYNSINRVMAEGAPPCYVAVDEERQLVYAANYHKGEINVYRIEENGGLKETDSVRHKGSGPDENQKSPHVHFTNLTPDARLVVCDLGTDEVYTYDVRNTGKISEAARFKAAPGTGPRHIVFHPNGKIAYLFGELNSTLQILNYEAKTGKFTTINILPTIPDDHTGHNGGAAIRISKDGKFLYLSNRGHNSIAVFKLSEDGSAAQNIQYISTEGDFPRDFAIDPTENFVVAANQNTDNLTLYSRDSGTGLLTLIEKDIFAPECVCVNFVDQ